ncbi:MAG: LysE family translocator [Sphaerochaetaceae bacterium]
MDIDFLALFSFAFITTFTPGPNTISSASMGLTYGYTASLPYFLGIETGFFSIMAASAVLSGFIQEYLPSFVRILSILGSLYILYLAFHTLKATYAFADTNQKPLGFFRGLVLQILNPKVIILGVTIYTTFLREMPRTFFTITLSALALVGMGFSAVTVWALFGSFIRTYMKKPWVKRIVNGVFFTMLLFLAIKLSGLLELLV